MKEKQNTDGQLMGMLNEHQRKSNEAYMVIDFGKKSASNKWVCLFSLLFYISHDNFIFFTIALNFSWYFINFSWLWMITYRYFLVN